ncbi:MAG: type II toxin-antitoxin system PemK/MazF family toxin [Kiritimatiellia bacterium]
MPPYIPTHGDLVVLSFDPQAGHEQMGRRPAIVVSVNSVQSRHPTGHLLPHHEYKARTLCPASARKPV